MKYKTHNFPPFNLLSFIHGNSDTQVGWKVANFFSSLDSEDFQEKKESAVLNLIPTKEHKCHKSTRVIHSNAQLSEFAIVKTSIDHNDIQTTYRSMARQIVHFAVFTCVNCLTAVTWSFLSTIDPLAIHSIEAHVIIMVRNVPKGTKCTVNYKKKSI